MRSIIVFLISISFYSCAMAQQIDRINVYVIPFGTCFISEKYHDADYVRTHYEFFVSIKQRDKIQEFNSIRQSVQKELLTTVDKSELGACRIVIDFIQASTIVESIVIHKSYSISFDEPYSQVNVFKYDAQLLCYLQDQFSAIIQMKHNQMNCK